MWAWTRPIRPGAIRTRQGNLAGIDVDLLSLLGREMGVRFEAVNLAPHLLAPELAARRVDLAAAGLVSTTERAKSMALSSPYLMLEQAVVVRSADPASGPAALSGRSVGVQIGSVAAAEARGAGGTVRAYDDLAIALAALARGEVQAVLGERPAAVDYVQTAPGAGPEGGGHGGRRAARGAWRGQGQCRSAPARQCGARRVVTARRSGRAGAALAAVSRGRAPGFVLAPAPSPGGAKQSSRPHLRFTSRH